MKKIIYIIFVFIYSASFSQALEAESIFVVNVKDSQEVVLYSARDCSHCYYYLPSDLRLSKRNGKVTEGSVVTWKNDNSSKTIGGILHFLIEWGLTKEKEQNVQKLLRTERDSLAVIMGSVLVNAAGKSVVIEGEDKLTQILKACLSNEPVAPTTPGSKVAFSFKFTESEIDDFLYFFRNADKSKTSIQLNYTYSLQSSGMEEIREVTLVLPLKSIFKLLKEQS